VSENDLPTFRSAASSPSGLQSSISALLIDSGPVYRLIMPNGTSGTSYAYRGTYDKDEFAKGYESSFAHIQKFNKASVQELVSVLSMIEVDKRIIDLRWTAYMLATMFIETSHTVRMGRGHHGKKVWRNFAPVEEVGHGRGHVYYFPAKVKRLHGGDARVTEWAGGRSSPP